MSTTLAQYCKPTGIGAPTPEKSHQNLPSAAEPVTNEFSIDDEEISDLELLSASPVENVLDNA